MRKFLGYLTLVILLLLAGAFGGRAIAQAITAATPYAFQSTGLVANCPAVAQGVNQWCFTTTGEYQSLNGSPWSLLVASAGVTSVTINNVAKGGPNPSFTLISNVPATPASITAQ